MIDNFPASEAAAVDIVRDHYNATRRLAILGGNTRAGFGSEIAVSARLRSSGLSGIVSYEPREMVMTARAGTPLSDIEAALDEHGQMMSFEPMDHRPLMGTSGVPTIGGVFAANVSGPRRLLAGAARDSLLGLRFINGRGELIKAGGRVMKNVTGLDLARLLAGSYGTLGFVTEVTFRAPPRPKTEATLVVGDLDDAGAAKAMAHAMAQSVEVSGAAHLPPSVRHAFLGGRLPETSATVLRLEGMAHSVEVRLKKLSESMSKFGPTSFIEMGSSRQLWREVRDVIPFADGTSRPVWRVSVAPSAGPQLVAALRLEAGVDAFYDWQGGLVWMRMEADAEAERLRGCIKAVGGGHATLMRASGAVRAGLQPFQPVGPAVAELSRRIKEKFDPSGIFNPGRMAGEW